MYPIVQVPDDAPDSPEQLGTKPKFWFYRETGVRWLFKEGRRGSGEHWAEKACAEIADLLGLPHAIYELANWRGRVGVISRNFVEPRSRLVFGNEVLARLITGYTPHLSRFRAREHRVSTVIALLRDDAIRLPLDFEAPAELERAADVFVGYLLLDALVANQDRHHENWGFVLTPSGAVHLAPTFDHASSLGRNERDAERLERLKTKDRGRSIGHYVERAESAFFPVGGSKRPLGTLEAFEEGARLRTASARYWLTRLSRIGSPDFTRVLDQIPRTVISQPAVDFGLALLDANRERLLKHHRE